MKNQTIKGGYKIISLNNIELPDFVGGDYDAGYNLPNLYELIEENYQKPILLEGITIDGVEKPSIFVTVEIEGEDFIINNVYGFKLILTTNEITAIDTRPTVRDITVREDPYTLEINDGDIVILRSALEDSVKINLPTRTIFVVNTLNQSFDNLFNGGTTDYLGESSFFINNSNEYIVSRSGNIIAVMVNNLED